MDYNDIRQLRLYARYDGFYASILLLGSFACFLALSLTTTGSWAWMGLTSLCPLIVLLTPIFIYRRLCKFRDEGLGGTISAKRALLYVLRTTTNAALFFSLLQYLYLALADNGLLAGVVERIVMADQQQTGRWISIWSSCAPSQPSLWPATVSSRWPWVACC